MAYVLFHSKEQGRPHVIKSFNTERGAKISRAAANRNAGYDAYEVMEELLFDLKYPRQTKVVKSLMTGKEVEIDSNTPHCCDPSSETYWSF